MVARSWALFLQELPDTGKMEQFLRAQYGIVRPCFFLGFAFRITLPIRLSWSEELGALQTVKVGTNLLCGKEPPDFGDERRQLFSEIGILL